MKKVVGIFVSKNRAIVHNGEKYLTCESNILDFLLRFQKYICCFYNLSYNVACLLSWLELSETQLKKLHADKDIWFDDYKLSYITGKFFAIKKGDYWDAPYTQFCDISQYITWKIEDNDSMEYEVAKAREAQKTGQQVYDALVKLGLNPDKGMTSPIRVYEKDKLNQMDLPTLDDIPVGASEYAYSCCKSGWFEVFKKGHFQHTYDYDISSAYGFGIANLLEIREGKWWQSQQYEISADYGYISGEITVESEFAPFVFTVENIDDAELYSLIGTWDYNLRRNIDNNKWEQLPYCITKRQYDILYKYNLGTFKIYDAWWFKSEVKSYPLRDAVNSLYDSKESAVGISREVPKRIITGIFGKQLETQKDSFGKHFNPVYGAEIEMQTRLDVFEACIQNNVVPISVALDGILVEKPMVLNMNNGMGSWKLSHEGKAIPVSTVAVAIEGKESDHDFAINYQWLLDVITDKPTDRIYSKSKLSPVGLDKAIAKNKMNTLGNIEQIDRSIDVAYENKRHYHIRPMTGQELINNKYESSALDISFMAIDRQ